MKAIKDVPFNRKQIGIGLQFHLQKGLTLSELSDLELVKMKKHLGPFLNCSISDSTVLPNKKKKQNTK